MPGVPSNKACERCKKRHLKCDETRPSCQRCENAGVECPGYVQTRKFIDQGATIRRRYAPYGETRPNQSTELHHENEDGEHATKKPAQNISGPSLAWVAAETDQPAFQSLENEIGINSRDITLQTDTVNAGRNEIDVQASSTDTQDSEKGRSVSFPTNALNPLSPNNGRSERFHSMGTVQSDLQQKSLNTRPTPSRSLSQRTEEEEFQDIFSELMTGTEHEIAFLIRHFSVTLGHWLDLWDSGKFFSAYVPVRAIDEPYLKFAMAALAAKHLGRVKGTVSTTGDGMFTNPATMEIYPNSSQVDWYLKAANYYYLAISRMNSTSDAYSVISSTAVFQSPIETINRWISLHLDEADLVPPADSTAPGTFWRRLENLLAASTILITYKLLDEPGENWQLHLTGIRPLFDTLLQLHSNHSDPPRFSHGAAASFLNFARHDYLGSYFTRTPTHFDPDNLLLWSAVGIPISDEGSLQLDNEVCRNKVMSTTEDLAANSLTWLLIKVINFLAEFKKSQVEQWTGQAPNDSPSSTVASPPSQPTTSTWLKLCFEYQSWVEHVPETFRPCLRLENPKNLSKLPETSQLPFPEIFYGMTSCAATMQQYHFGRIALLLNRPPDVLSAPSTAIDRLQGYRELTKEVDYRCREICGIALGRPQGGARIYMITLLFAVGQFLESPEERQIITDLLRGVEADLGWATSSQIQKLQSIWDQR